MILSILFIYEGFFYIWIRFFCDSKISLNFKFNKEKFEHNPIKKMSQIPLKIFTK